MTTDDQQRIEALLDERAKLIRERERCTEDLAELLDAAQAVSRAAEGARLDPSEVTLLEAIDALNAALARFDAEP
jgi:transcriptional regulator with XRE-family HTH domain